MSEPLKDLAVSYPFMPEVTTPDALKHIKDVRLVYTLPAVTATIGNSHTLTFHASLISINAYEASFQVVCTPFAVDTLVTVPVYIGVDTCPATNSYVLVDAAVSYSGTHKLHPDCLLFLQEAPKLFAVSRLDITKEDVATNVSSNAFGKRIKIENGNNVVVTGSSKTLRFTGGVGAGTGVYTSSPWIDATLVPDETKGLISINGITNDVIITGAPSVTVSSLPGTYLEINPNPIPQPTEGEDL